MRPHHGSCSSVSLSVCLYGLLTRRHKCCKKNENDVNVFHGNGNSASKVKRLKPLDDKEL